MKNTYHTEIYPNLGMFRTKRVKMGKNVKKLKWMKEGNKFKSRQTA